MNTAMRYRIAIECYFWVDNSYTCFVSFALHLSCDNLKYLLHLLILNISLFYLCVQPFNKNENYVACILHKYVFVYCSMYGIKKKKKISIDFTRKE